MSLIERAAQQTGKTREASMLERAAERGWLSAPPAAPAAPPPQAPEALEGPAPDFGPAAKPAPRQSRRVGLDFARLQARPLVTPDNRRSRLSEEVRLIKRRLMQRMRMFSDQGDDSGRPDNVLLVTSARPDEGKSFISLNLALSFAIDEGFNVLLVDADVLRPSILPILGLEASGGLTDILRDPSIGLSEVLLRTENLPLSILPPGSHVASATELFGGPQMAALVHELAGRYPDRIIVIDSPPLLASTEPVVLAQHVDQILFVVEAGQTPRASIEAALDLLPERNNINFILNKSFISGGSDQFGAYYRDTPDQPD